MWQLSKLILLAPLCSQTVLPVAAPFMVTSSKMKLPVPSKSNPTEPVVKSMVSVATPPPLMVTVLVALDPVIELNSCPGMACVPPCRLKVTGPLMPQPIKVVKALSNVAKSAVGPSTV